MKVRYVGDPFEVIEWTGKNFLEIVDFCRKHGIKDPMWDLKKKVLVDSCFIYIGDFLRDNGKPLPRDAFERDYEVVEEEA